MKPNPHRFLALALLIFAVAPLDAGAQWVNTNGPTGPATTALTFSGATLVAGTAGGGVFVASGGYTSWSAASSGLTDPDILSLASTVNEFGGEVVVAGTDGGGVFSSLNHGASWSPASEGLTNTTVPAVVGVADSYFGYGMVLFAGTEGGVFRSNGGFLIIWVPRSGGMTNPLLQALVTIPGGDENDGMGARDLIAGTDNGAFLSTDGVTWWPKSTGLTDPDVTALAATTPGPSLWNLFAATPGGVFRSTSLGGDWAAAGAGLPAGTVRTLLGVGSWIFAGTSGDGVFLSTNQGVSWTPVSTGLPDVAVTALASNGVDLFAGTASGVFRRPLSEFDPTTAVEDGAPGVFVGVPHPNPFGTSLAVAYRLETAGAVRITVHDTQGRRVAELMSGERPAGEHQVRWDGRNESGSAVRPGMYFLRFEAAGQVAKRRVVLSR